MNSTIKTILAVVVVVALVGIFMGRSKVSAPETNTVGTEENQVTASTTYTTGATGTKPTTGTTPVKSNKQPTTGTTVSVVPSDTFLMPLINSAKISVPQTGQDVKLVQGRAEFTHGSTKGTVALGKILGKVATDNGYDVFLEMTVTNGNAAPLRYVIAFLSLGQGVQYTSSVLIGDKVDLTGVIATADTTTTITAPKPYMSNSIGYKLTLSYLNLASGGPLTAEQKGTQTMGLKVKNHVVTK